MAFLNEVRHRVTACVAIAASLVLWLPARAEQVTDYDVKAAFLYNFTRFVGWPDGIPASPHPFRLCVVADGAMTSAVQRTMEGESVDGRPTVTLSPSSPREARTCQILFVGHSEMERAAPMLTAVRALPVLTVGDGESFIDRGGMIQFVLERGRVRFDVNLAAARRTNLSVSSRLLQVARNVEGNRQ